MKTAGWHDIAKAIGYLPDDTELCNVLYSSVLFGLAVVQQPKTVVEIGTQLGFSSRVWLAATEEIQGEVHSIDVDPDCAKLELGPRWHFHLGKSQEIESIDCDLLYVDGDHSYEAVCSDMARHGVKVRNGGLVVLDDYYASWPGKMRWVDERAFVLDPIIIGPTAVFKMTPQKRLACGLEYP